MSRGALAAVAAIGGYAAVLVHTAWLGDDAFITLRVVDHALTGHGLRFDVSERVMVYTHPLWMLVLLGARALTGETYLTTVGISALVSLAAAVVVVRGAAPDLARGALAVWVLTQSMAFVDYSTSGLENPLTHLLLAVGLVLFLSGERVRPRAWRGLCVVAALMLLNRIDSALLIAPWLAVAAWGRPRAELARGAAIGAALVLPWVAFATVYYGSPWPNTALAKLGLGVDRTFLLRQGVDHLAEQVTTDPSTVVLVALGVLASLTLPDRRWRAVAVSLAAALAYPVWIGGDFMVGRFLAAPALLAAVAVVHHPWVRRPPVAGAVAVAAVLGSGAAGLPPMGPRPAGPHVPHGHERAFYDAALGLRSPSRVGAGLGHDFARVGQALAARPGPHLLGAVGLAGFHGGPGLDLVDVLALTDPLLARLPARAMAVWRPGHYRRLVPAGYLTSRATGADAFLDPAVAACWADVVLVSRAPLFAAGRWAAIGRLLAQPGCAQVDRSVYAATGLPEVTAADVASVQEDGLRWAEPPEGQPVLGDVGLTVRWPAPVDAPYLDLSLSSRTTWRADWLRDGEVVASETWDTPPTGQPHAARRRTGFGWWSRQGRRVPEAARPHDAVRLIPEAPESEGWVGHVIPHGRDGLVRPLAALGGDPAGVLPARLRWLPPLPITVPLDGAWEVRALEVAAAPHDQLRVALLDRGEAVWAADLFPAPETADLVHRVPLPAGVRGDALRLWLVDGRGDSGIDRLGVVAGP